MIELLDIEAIVLKTVKLLKNGQAKVDKGKVVTKDISFNPTYLRSLKLWKDIAVHSEGQHFPESLFKKAAPNEDPETYDYRKDNYQPVTQSDWDRGIINYDRVFNPQNYSIDWGEDEYFTEDYPLGGNIMSHFKSVVKDKKLEDPNALMALMIENKDAPDNVERKPYGLIYHTDQVLLESKEAGKEYIFVMSDEKTEVEHGSVRMKVGFVFYLYDTNAIWKISQKGRFTDWLFDIEEYFKHEFGYIPAQRLKGKIFNIGEHVYFKSHVNSAVYPLNYIAYDNSTLQASKIKHAYLEKWEIEDECQNTACQDGYVEEKDDNEEVVKRTCQVCEGSNRSTKKGVLGVKTILARTGQDIDPGLSPPMGYVDKDPGILTFLREEIQSNQKDSFAFIGVDISATNAKGSETALGKVIDREALENSLLIFSNEIYELLRFNVQFVNDARRKFGTNEEDPEIKEPTNFTIRTEKDLTEEFETAADLPDAYRVEIFAQLLNTRFANKPMLKRILQLKQEIDGLFLLSRDQVGLVIGRGVAAKWEDRLHAYFDTYIAQEVKKDDKFLEKKDEEIAEVLITKAKLETPAPVGTTNQIINTTIDEPIV